MSITAVIKIVCGVMAAVFYVIGASTLYEGATQTAKYTPNNFAEWFVTAAGTVLVTFIAAQIGVTVGQQGATIADRFKTALHGTAVLNDNQRYLTIAVLVVIVIDFLVLTFFGIRFIQLSLSPEQIKVPDGAEALKEAPDYITLQAKAYVALVFAGAAGVTAGALKA